MVKRILALSLLMVGLLGVSGCGDASVNGRNNTHSRDPEIIAATDNPTIEFNCQMTCDELNTESYNTLLKLYNTPMQRFDHVSCMIDCNGRCDKLQDIRDLALNGCGAVQIH